MVVIAGVDRCGNGNQVVAIRFSQREFRYDRKYGETPCEWA
jgi:hypothetical protein